MMEREFLLNIFLEIKNLVQETLYIYNIYGRRRGVDERKDKRVTVESTRL